MPQSCNFIKKRLQHRCFPLDFEKFLRKPFFYTTALVAASRRAGAASFCNEKIELLYILLIQKFRYLDRQHFCQISKAILKVIFCALTSSRHTKAVIKSLENK